MTQDKKFELVVKGLTQEINHSLRLYDFPNVEVTYHDLSKDGYGRTIGVYDYRKESNVLDKLYQFKTMKEFWQIIEKISDRYITEG